MMRVNLQRLWIGALACAVFLSSPPPSYPGAREPVRETSTGVVVSLSDIHFDPFYDPSLLDSLIKSDETQWQSIFSQSAIQGFGTHSADTNYNLLNSALESVYEAAPHPDFIIISGDFLAHDFQATYTKLAGDSDPGAIDSFIDKTIAFVSGMIVRRFPDTPVYPALGNNDSYCGDYQIEPNGQFLHHTARTWKSFFKTKANSASFLRTFEGTGSYSVMAPKTRAHRLIVLNNTFFSINYKNACGDQSRDPGSEQIKWLDSELGKAAKAREKVWLVYHIPPGIDVFSTLHQEPNPTDPLPKTISFWQTVYNQPFIDLVRRYSSTIIGSFAGHMHMDTFELIQSTDHQAISFVHVTPAISPLFGNNPGFKLFSYNRRSFAPRDYTTYYLDLTTASGQTNAQIKWSKEYSFRESYHEPIFSASTLQAVQNDMAASGSDKRGKYEMFYDVSNNSSAAISSGNWVAYWCAITKLTAPEYERCLTQR
jgi:hypothetical protein